MTKSPSGRVVLCDQGLEVRLDSPDRPGERVWLSCCPARVRAEEAARAELVPGALARRLPRWRRAGHVDDTVVRLPAVLFGRAIAGPRPQPPRQAASRSK